MNDKRLKITVFDVGHGDHIVVEFPSNGDGTPGDVGIIDCCFKEDEEEPPAISYLRGIRENRGATSPLSIRFLCISHPHSDHIKGLAQLILSEEFEIQELWHSMSLGTEQILNHLNRRTCRVFGDAVPIANYERERSDLRILLKYLVTAFKTDHPKLVSLIDMRDICKIGDVDIECVGPSEKALRYYLRRVGKDVRSGGEWAIRQYGNRISAMILLTYGQNRVLLTGDAIKANWRELHQRLIDVGRGDEVPYEIVKAPHHGSRHSLTPEMWDQMVCDEGIVCVSALGRSTPVRQFYTSAKGRHLFCTNRGPCRFIGRGQLGVPCCGDISITIGRSKGDIGVFPESKPLHH